jgi:hypothetical protein
MGGNPLLSNLSGLWYIKEFILEGMFCIMCSKKDRRSNEFGVCLDYSWLSVTAFYLDMLELPDELVR